jgi:ribosomal protein L30/L7E
VRRNESRRRITRQLRVGDWLVQQVNSQIGEEEHVIGTLAELGLCKIGRCGLFEGADGTAWGQIVRVQHLVAIRALTLHPSNEGRVRDEAAQMIAAVAYRIDDNPAVHYTLDGDSFVSAEAYEDRVALNWSTALPFGSVLERLPSAVTRTVRTVIVFDPAASRQRALREEERTGLLSGDGALYPFVRLDVGPGVLVWQRPAYPQHVDEDVSAGRIGLLIEDLQADWLEPFLHATATPLVAALAGRVLRDARRVLDGGESELKEMA